MTSSSPPLRLLVVDDEPAIVGLLETMLKDISKEIVVETSNDGYDACVKAGILVPDIILLDIKLPYTDGFELCRSIRNNAETKHAKIIVISGVLDEEKLRKLERFSPIEVMAKPFDLDQLGNKVRILLEIGKKH